MDFLIRGLTAFCLDIMVQRFKPVVKTNTHCHPDPNEWTTDAVMVNHHSGQWVKLKTFDDAIAQKNSEIKHLKNQLKQYRKI
jgi:hypothetical protein